MKGGAFLASGADTCVYDPVVKCQPGTLRSKVPPGEYVSRIVDNNEGKKQSAAKRIIQTITKIKGMAILLMNPYFKMLLERHLLHKNTNPLTASNKRNGYTTHTHHNHGHGSTPPKQTHTYTPARERAPEPHAPKHSIQERVPPVSYHHMLLAQASSNQMLTAKRGACAGLTS